MAATIRIDITHVGLGMELRQLMFNKDLTLSQLKDKLYLKTGTEPSCMLLALIGGEGHGAVTNDGGNRNGIELRGDEQTLNILGLVNGSRLEMRDLNDSSEANVAANALNKDDLTIKKYEAKRGDSGFAKFRKEAAAAACRKAEEKENSDDKAAPSGAKVEGDDDEI